MKPIIWIAAAALIAAGAACNAPRRPPVETPTAPPPPAGDPGEATQPTAAETLRPTPTSGLPDIAGTLDAQGSATPDPSQQGKVTGTIRYPSEGHPAMRVYALRTDRQHYLFVDIEANQGSYSFTLPPGEYFILADLGPASPDGFEGGYTVYSRCMIEGSGSGACSPDPSLIAIRVQPGQIVSNIDLYDWFPQEAVFPPIPG